MGISDSKTWVCICDECNDSYDDLAVYKSDFMDTLEDVGWKITKYGKRAICPKCKGEF